MRRGFYIDEDTTDAFMDGPQPRYAGGKTLWERLESQGYDVSPAGMATLRTQISERHRADGRELTPLPPPVDH